MLFLWLISESTLFKSKDMPKLKHHTQGKHNIKSHPVGNQFVLDKQKALPIL